MIIRILPLSCCFVREPEARSSVAATWYCELCGWGDSAAVLEAARITSTAPLAEEVAERRLPVRLATRLARLTPAAPVCDKSLVKQTTV